MKWYMYLVTVVETLFVKQMMNIKSSILKEGPFNSKITSLN